MTTTDNEAAPSRRANVENLGDRYEPTHHQTGDSPMTVQRDCTSGWCDEPCDGRNHNWSRYTTAKLTYVSVANGCGGMAIPTVGTGVSYDGDELPAIFLHLSGGNIDEQVDMTIFEARELVDNLGRAISIMAQMMRNGLPLINVIDREPCSQCAGTQKVTMCTGKWTYTAPCPDCDSEAFDAAEIDDDHFIVPRPESKADNRVDRARDDLDAAQDHLTDVLGRLDGARRTRVEEIRDRIGGVLADLDRLSAAL